MTLSLHPSCFNASWMAPFTLGSCSLPARSVSRLRLSAAWEKPSHATDSEMTDDDVIIRFQDDEIIGLTVLRASER